VRLSFDLKIFAMPLLRMLEKMSPLYTKFPCSTSRDTKRSITDWSFAHWVKKGPLYFCL